MCTNSKGPEYFCKFELFLEFVLFLGVFLKTRVFKTFNQIYNKRGKGYVHASQDTVGCCAIPVVGIGATWATEKSNLEKIFYKKTL